MTGDARSPQPTQSRLVPRSRVGVSLLFLINGFVVGCWATKIPEFAMRLGLTKFELGLMVLLAGVGSLIAMPMIGAQIAVRGSRPVALAAALLLSPMLLALSLVSNIVAGGVAVFLFGAFMGGMDVAMNANAVAVERSMRRAIMSSCHAFWSLGGLFGSGISGYLISHLGISLHAWIAFGLYAIWLIIAWPLVLADPPHPSETKSRSRLPLTPLPWLIGLMALFCMVPEGAVLDWSAFYLRQDFGASLTLSGFGFAAFSCAMAVMRFAGDLVRDRLGAVKTLRICTCAAIIGMVVAALAPNAGLAIAGFCFCGIGLSNMVPIAFSAGGNIPGLKPGIGISTVSMMGYAGLLVAPSIIGFGAEHIGFPPIFLILPALLVVVLLLSGFARYADDAKNAKEDGNTPAADLDKAHAAPH